MARTVTLSQMLTDVRWRGDITSMTLRHTDTDLVRCINQSWQALRLKVSDAGSGSYLTAATGSLTAGVLAGSGFGTVDWPGTAVAIYGVDVTVTAGTDIRCLEPGSFEERNSYLDRWGNTTGIPRVFCPYNLGTESTTTTTAGKIALFPAPDKAYTYTLWYLPSWTDIAAGNTTYVFDGVAGFEEWVVWDVVVKIAARENDMQNTAQIAMSERDRIWREVIQPACRPQRVGPVRRADIASIRRIQGRTVPR